jgi:transcriptional regulator with XRE-family HTH domain
MMTKLEEMKMELASFIKKARGNSSQAKFGEKVKLKQPYVAELEKGLKIPSWDKAIEIAKEINKSERENFLSCVVNATTMQSHVRTGSNLQIEAHTKIKLRRHDG